MNTFNDEIKVAIKAAIEAGYEIMKIYSEQDFNVALKADDSPITKADKKANKIITEALLKTNIPIISEENKIMDYDVRKHWKQCWVVDPLDGTKEFINKNGEFTVNIALVVNQKPVLGVIYIPVLKELYYGSVLEKRAHKSVVDSSKGFTLNTKVLSGPQKTHTSQIKVVGSRSHFSSATENFVSSLREANQEIEIVSVGSSLKFCLMAEGKATIYPRFSPTMEWDTAAGDAICTAVGLKVYNANTKQPLKYNKKELVNPSFIVN